MTDYPEKVPSKEIENFLFSFSFASKAQAEIQKDFEILQQRISTITDSEKFHVQDFPVLKNIMILQPTKEELKKLSKALDRLADLVEIYKQLNDKLQLIKTLRENQAWFTNTFADFTEEIDRDLEKLLNTLE